MLAPGGFSAGLQTSWTCVRCRARRPRQRSSGMTSRVMQTPTDPSPPRARSTEAAHSISNSRLDTCTDQIWSRLLGGYLPVPGLFPRRPPLVLLVPGSSPQTLLHLSALSISSRCLRSLACKIDPHGNLAWSGADHRPIAVARHAPSSPAKMYRRAPSSTSCGNMQRLPS